ncbi:hypothetical protein [Desulforamulus reducens]|nr:hypothetical protein [Desulforamulus reducens]
MEIKADKQRAFNTSTMTSSGNYNARSAEELSKEIGIDVKPSHKMDSKQ